MIRRIAMVVPFVAVFGSVWGGLHYYAWARLARDTGLPAPLQVTIALALAALALAPFLARAVELPRRIAGFLHDGAFGWFGVLGLVDVALFVTDLARWGLSLAYASTPVDPGGLAGAQLQAVVALAGGLGLAGTAFRNTRRPAPLKRVEVTLDRWPKALDGYRIVQLSDVHVTPGTDPAWVQDLVNRSNAEAPDLVALTGDLVDGSPDQLVQGMKPFAGLRARHGMFFVTGNHEYYSGGDRWIAHNRALGMRVLQNERVTIGEGDAAFELAGVPDWRGSGFGRSHEPRLADALAGRPPDREVILLAHQPRQFPEAAALDVGLQLSGHTHGGQVWPFTYIVRLAEPFVAGLYRQGQSQLYVSRGTGWWGPAMRLASPHELTVITIRAA